MISFNDAETRYVVWDWNGTLLDDMDVCFEGINILLSRYDLKPIPDIETYRSIFTFPVKDYYSRAGFDFNRVPFEDLSREFINYYLKHSPSCELTPGAVETLEYLQKAGYRQIVLSAAHCDMLLDQIERYGLSRYFEEILGLGNIHAADKVQLARDWRKRTEFDRVVMIGDTLHDLETSRALGGSCVLYRGGHQHLPGSPDYKMIHRLEELKEDPLLLGGRY